MGFGRTARGRSFVYHAGTAVEGVGGTCGSRGGMVSWPRSWHTPCRAWYWCQATRSLRSTRIVRGMWSHRDCGMRRQETWCRSAADALFHHSVTVSCHGPQVLSHMLRNATFQCMQWMSRLWTMVTWWRGHMGHLGLVWSHGAPVPSHRTWPQSHLTQGIRRSPRIGSQDTQCAPSKVTTRLRWRIHFRTGVGAGPPHIAISSGRRGS